MKPETRLTNRILKELRLEGGFWFKVHGGPMQESGIPDIIGCYMGRFVALEVKLPNSDSKLSLRQRAKLHSIRHSGGYPYVVRSTLDALRVTSAIRKELDASDQTLPYSGELRSTEK